MRRFALIFAVCAVIASAQMPITRVIGGISEALRRFLELTDTQTRQIMQINREFAEWQVSRATRQVQLRVEVSIEEKKSPLDPMALGLRYAELESIRREVEEEAVRVRRRILALFTDAQRQKVTELERARTLAPVITDAECHRILSSPEPDTIARFAGSLSLTVPIANCGLLGILTTAP